MFSAHLEFARPKPTAEAAEKVIDAFESFHPASGESTAGRLDVQISVPGETLAQAITIALNAAQVAGLEVIKIDAMPEAEFDRRLGLEPLPALVGTSEAAEILGVSRQRIQQLHAGGQLPGQQVGGKSLAFSRAAVDAFADLERGSGRPAARRR